MVIETVDPLRFCFRFAQGGQKHAGEDRDNGDDNEEFDQSETLRFPAS
jgi:hypothetical protein